MVSVHFKVGESERIRMFTCRSVVGKTNCRRPCPRDFRERYIEMGWDGQI